MLRTRTALRAAGLLIALAIVPGVFAAAAAAASHSRTHDQKVRAELLRAVKKNPRVVLRKSFLRKASLVKFALPVTVRLRGSNNTTPISPVFGDVNPNSATVDLGSSLGNRQVSIGGSLPAEVDFNDQYDGGPLGNVRVRLTPSVTGGLVTTSIPLLWNRNVSTFGSSHEWWGTGFDNGAGLNPQTGSVTHGEYDDGCGGFTGNADLPTPITQIGVDNSIVGLAQPGIPYFNPTADPPSEVDPTGASGNALSFQSALGAAQFATASTYVAGFVPAIPGVDSLTALKVSGETTPQPLGDDIINNMGLNPDPFPTGDDPGFDPLNDIAGPNVQDTVLRTAPITLRIASAGTRVSQVDDSQGVDGSQNIVIGASGGQANLFGNIPGKAWGIDVTVSLEGKINSIMRVVDPDDVGLIAGAESWPAALTCRQVFTGAVQNYFPGLRLRGDLQISPAITKDGRLRIAKARLSSLEKTQFAVAACLAPHAMFASEANSSDTTPTLVPNAPINEATRRGVPDGVSCNDTPTELIRTAGLGVQNLTTLTGSSSGYTTTADGSRVSVAALLGVDNVSADILIGKNQ